MSDRPQQSDASELPAEKKWQPLSREQRRIVGVLVEKAKTTPDSYPMTLNALTTGCNQKSNRSPKMELASDDVEVYLDELKTLGAVTEIQSAGRAPKFRHNMYDWLGVDKTELAVMAELLLRGEQTTGELRGRAARMEPIADVSALRPIVAELINKGLVQSLTPEGRGQVVSHALYEPHELDKVQARADAMASEKSTEKSSGSSGRASRSTGAAAQIEELKSLVESLAAQVAELNSRVESLEGK